MTPRHRVGGDEAPPGLLGDLPLAFVDRDPLRGLRSDLVEQWLARPQGR